MGKKILALSVAIFSIYMIMFVLSYNVMKMSIFDIIFTIEFSAIVSILIASVLTLIIQLRKEIRSKG